MATAVESRIVPADLMVVHPVTSPEEKALEEKINIQNAYLAFTVVRNMLKKDNLNGLHRCQLAGSSKQFTHEYINEASFKDALDTLEKVCRHLSARENEIESLVDTLDTSDSQLYKNYQCIAQHLLVLSSEVRFGRIGSLFFFTYLLCKRLHKDNRSKEVESVIDWLALFLNENVTPWLIQKHHGQWVCIVRLHS